MKTLIVTYLPRNERSKTKLLVDKFLEEARAKSVEIDVLDLLKETPDLFLETNLNAYTKRNYGKEELNEEEKTSMKKMDAMTEQFKSADAVVVAFPMYNFSQPAAVKAWFDSILQKGETWDVGANGYIGLMKGKKALVLMSSGGVYEGEMKNYEHAMSLTKGLFGFMGFEDIRGISAAGVNAKPDNADEIVSNAQAEVSKTVQDWY